jgi:hypothetical protein
MAAKDKPQPEPESRLQGRIDTAQRRLERVSAKHDSGPELRQARKKLKRAQRALSRWKSEEARRAPAKKEKKSEASG